MSCCKPTSIGTEWTPPNPSRPFVTGLQVNNSLTGGKCSFIPNEGNVVNWYGCGPTVYDAAHMGHARNYISFDIMRRLMEDYFGYKVNMCMNVTDIDDKIISRANELGIPFNQLSRFWENDFMTNMKDLNCKLPDVITRVSEYVPQIVAFTERIIKNGFAYESGGSVYFDTTAFRQSDKHTYGRMEPWSVNDEARVLEGEGALTVLTEKKCALDFALWKKVKAGEPSWDSPWGKGRPGWHIECSAMASDILGFPLDLHSGGVDLRFPHHDNELAQTEAAFDQPQWVNYFLHSGHLHIKGLKMSKSLKNFITIKAILQQYSARVVRLLVLLHKWDQPMNYDPEGSSMKEPLEVDRILQHFLGSMHQVLRKSLAGSSKYASSADVDFSSLEGLNSPQDWTEAEKSLFASYETIQTSIHSALCDNFNTPLAMTKIIDLISDVNVYLRNQDETNYRGPLLNKVYAYIKGLLTIFGVIREEEGTSGTSGEEFAGLMDEVAAYRFKVRELARSILKSPETAKETATELLAMSDTFRDSSMVELGIRLEDKGDRGFIWKLSNKSDILAERARRAAEEAAAAELKATRQAEIAEAKLRKERELAIPPEEYFKTTRGEEFSEYDETGLPIKMADGTEISKSMKDKMRKALAKHRVQHEERMKSQ